MIASGRDYKHASYAFAAYRMSYALPCMTTCTTAYRYERSGWRALALATRARTQYNNANRGSPAPPESTGSPCTSPIKCNKKRKY